MSDHPILPYAPSEPATAAPVQAPTTGAVPAPLGVDDPNFHCPNCLFIEVKSDPSQSFWACQSLCIRE